MLNRCEFIGNLGKDPDVRVIQSGDKVVNLSIGVTDRWKDKDGNRQERTTWVPVVIWGNLASIAEQYCRKGSKVYVAGEFATRKWTDKDGNDRYSTEVVLQKYRGQLVLLDKAEPRQNEASGTSNDEGWQRPVGGSGTMADGDEIPFAPEWR